MVIGEQLMEYMRQRGITQTQLACELGVATSQLNRWLRRGRMSRLWIEKLKNIGVLGFDLNQYR